MKLGIKRILMFLALIGLTIGSLVVRHNVSEQRSLLTCDGINVFYDDDLRFISEDDVKNLITEKYGPFLGKALDSISLKKIEKILDAQSAVVKSQAYITDDSKLNIRLDQREPSVRFVSDNAEYYASSDGYMFPIQKNFTTLVPVFDGAIPISYEKGYKGMAGNEKDKEWLKNALAMADYISADEGWNRIIVQMHVNDNGDIILIPRQGNERFVFGGPTNIKNKLDKIRLYYNYIIPEKGEGYYRTVNVKYENQIICKQ